MIRPSDDEAVQEVRVHLVCLLPAAQGTLGIERAQSSPRPQPLDLHYDGGIPAILLVSLGFGGSLRTAAPDGTRQSAAST